MGITWDGYEYVESDPTKPWLDESYDSRWVSKPGLSLPEKIKKFFEGKTQYEKEAMRKHQYRWIVDPLHWEVNKNPQCPEEFIHSEIKDMLLSLDSGNFRKYGYLTFIYNNYPIAKVAKLSSERSIQYHIGDILPLLEIDDEFGTEYSVKDLPNLNKAYDSSKPIYFLKTKPLISNEGEVIDEGGVYISGDTPFQSEKDLIDFFSNNRFEAQHFLKRDFKKEGYHDRWQKMDIYMKPSIDSQAQFVGSISLVDGITDTQITDSIIKSIQDAFHEPQTTQTL